MPFKQRARLPLSAVIGLHRAMDAGVLGREPELERPPFKHSPRNSVSLIHSNCGSGPSLAWHRHQKPGSNV